MEIKMELEHGKKYLCEIKAIYGKGSYQEVLTYDGYHKGFLIWNGGVILRPFDKNQKRLTVLRAVEK